MVSASSMVSHVISPTMPPTSNRGHAGRPEPPIPSLPRNAADVAGVVSELLQRPLQLSDGLAGRALLEKRFSHGFLLGQRYRGAVVLGPEVTASGRGEARL